MVVKVGSDLSFFPETAQLDTRRVYLFVFVNKTLVPDPEAKVTGVSVPPGASSLLFSSPFTTHR